MNIHQPKPVIRNIKIRYDQHSLFSDISISSKTLTEGIHLVARLLVVLPTNLLVSSLHLCVHELALEAGESCTLHYENWGSWRNLKLKSNIIKASHYGFQWHSFMQSSLKDLCVTWPNLVTIHYSGHIDYDQSRMYLWKLAKMRDDNLVMLNIFNIQQFLRNLVPLNVHHIQVG